MYNRTEMPPPPPPPPFVLSCLPFCPKMSLKRRYYSFLTDKADDTRKRCGRTEFKAKYEGTKKIFFNMSNGAKCCSMKRAVN